MAEGNKGNNGLILAAGVAVIAYLMLRDSDADGQGANSPTQSDPSTSSLVRNDNLTEDKKAEGVKEEVKGAVGDIKVDWDDVRWVLQVKANKNADYTWNGQKLEVGTWNQYMDQMGKSGVIKAGMDNKKLVTLNEYLTMLGAY